MAMGNNPMMMVDEDGEWVFAALAVGALIGAGSYTASIAFSKGGFDNWNWGGFFQSAGVGAISGAFTAGIGSAFGGLGGGATSFGGQVLNEAGRAVAHGLVQGNLSVMQGGSFKNGFASGGLSSIASSGFSAGGDFAKSALGGTSFGALSGGIGAELSGGDFWRGAGQGATVALLNHYMHQVEGNLNENRARKKRAKAYAEQAFDGISLTDSRAVIKQYEPDFYDRWSESSNFFANLSYDLVDGIWVTAQSFIKGPHSRHLNGTTVVGNDRVDGFVNTVQWGIAFGELSSFKAIKGGFFSKRWNLRVQAHSHPIAPLKGTGAKGTMAPLHININNIHINPKYWKYYYKWFK